MATIESERTVNTKACLGITKAGNPCRSTAIGKDGYCAVHDPNSPYDVAELGRKGGRKSANTERARRKAETSREILRSAFATDTAWRKALVEAYRRPIMAGGKEALSAANDLINQIEGKPQQNIQTKHDVSITVVSRLGAALERAPADVELDPSSVRELEA